MGCHCEERDNCRLVLRKVHEMFKKANCLFEKSENLVDHEVIESLCYSIKALRKSLELAKIGYAIEGKAAEILANSDCQDKCNAASPVCQELLAEAVEQFTEEEAQMIAALALMEQALAALEDSIVHRKAGYIKFEQYTKCVHSKRPHPCPHPVPHPPCPRRR